MREIKFRAWDKKRKRMFAVTTLNASGAVSVFIDDDGLYLLPAEQIELMQYTGLKDKNGKEIYEGDIVKSGPYCGKPIVFEEGRYWLGEEPDDLFTSSVRWDIEIIGNIHENPELLKEKL